MVRAHIALLVLCLSAMAAGCDERPPAPPRPPAPVPLVGAYLDYHAGLAEAARRDLPLLLLVGTNRYRCPPAARLEDALFKPGGREHLEPLCVLARLDMDEPRHAKAAEAFRARHRLRTLPALYLLAPDGDELFVISTGLYGCYAVDARALPDFAAPLLSAEDLALRVAQAREPDRRERAWLESTAGTNEAGLVVERAAVLLRRSRLDAARAEAQRAATLPQAAGASERLVAISRALGETPTAGRLLRGLLAGTPTALERLRWGRWLQQLEPEAPDLVGPMSLAGLRALAKGEKAAGQEALLVLELLLREGPMHGPDRARELLAWLEAHLEALASEPLEGPAALASLGARAQALGRADLAVRCVELLLARFPDSEEAQAPKHGILDQWRREAAKAHGG